MGRNLVKHTVIGEQTGALEALPDLSAASRQPIRATGTDDTRTARGDLASCLALSSDFSRTSVDSDRRFSHARVFSEVKAVQQETAISPAKNELRASGLEPETYGLKGDPETPPKSPETTVLSSTLASL